MNELNKTLNQNIEEMMGLTRSVAKQQAAAFRRKDALSTQMLAQVVTNPELLPEDNEVVMLMMNFNPMSVPVTKKSRESSDFIQSVKVTY